MSYPAARAAAALDRAALAEWYRRTRVRSRAVFDLLDEDVNTLLKKALGHPGLDADLER